MALEKHGKLWIFSPTLWPPWRMLFGRRTTDVTVDDDDDDDE